MKGRGSGPNPLSVTPSSSFLYLIAVERTMAAPGDVYERELKSLLTGEEQAVSNLPEETQQKINESLQEAFGDIYLAWINDNIIIGTRTCGERVGWRHQERCTYYYEDVGFESGIHGKGHVWN